MLEQLKHLLAPNLSLNLPDWAFHLQCLQQKGCEMKFLSNYWYQAKCLIFPFIRLTWSMNDKSNVCFGKKKLNHFGWMFRFYSLLVLLLPAISTSSQISITFLGVMCSMSVGSPSIVKYFMNIAIVSVSPNAVASIHFGPNSARLILPSAVSQRRNTIVNCSQKLLWESPKLFHLLHNWQVYYYEEQYQHLSP